MQRRLGVTGIEFHDHRRALLAFFLLVRLTPSYQLAPDA